MDNWELKPARGIEEPPVQRYRSIAREDGLLESILRVCWWSCVRSSLTLFHRVEYHGRENLPKNPSFVIAANHESHLDALVIGTALPLRMRNQLFPLAAGDLFFEVPAVAAFSALALNALPVWRRNCGKQGLEDLRNKLLDEPCAYILFPEGTRTRTGQMGDFRAGVGMFTAGTSVPVIPCFLRGTFEAFPPNRVVPRFKKIAVWFGEPLSFDHVDNHRAGWNLIASKIEAAVKQLAETAPR
jgi:1-acyl-sn-glycerol-3-phosphate acyltransferase